MAGHSKWKNIRHKKAKQDARKGKIFTKLIRELTVSSRNGGMDPATNNRLRAAIQAALSENMSRDTIDRAISRGAGSEGEAQLEEIRYEGYGAGGVAVMVDCMTDNRNRTAGEVRHAFSKCGGNLGAEGSVAYLFSRKGVLQFSKGISEAQLMEVALELGAEDVVEGEEGFVIYAHPDSFSEIQEGLDKVGLRAEHAEITEVPATEVLLEDVEIAQKVLKLIDTLEDLDDVQQVYANFEVSELLGDLDATK